MDPDGLSLFLRTLRQTSCYLEYGCGGSTLAAAETQEVRRIITVDTDSTWLEKIEKESRLDKEIKFIHVDLGPISSWGTPISAEKYKEFYTYITAPWVFARSCPVVPDLILIDGRFRVACFLYSLYTARCGTLILFDDYFDRPEYHLVEQFCPVEGRYGRLATFRVSRGFDANLLLNKLLEYVNVLD